LRKQNKYYSNKGAYLRVILNRFEKGIGTDLQAFVPSCLFETEITTVFPTWRQTST